MLVKNTAEAMKFYHHLLSVGDSLDIPPEDQAPYENGYFIHFSKICNFFHTLDSIWNSNEDLTQSDYVRHYTGPLGRHYHAGIIQKTIFKGIHIMIQTQNKLLVLMNRKRFTTVNIQERLQRIYKISCKAYAQYFDSRIQL